MADVMANEDCWIFYVFVDIPVNTTVMACFVVGVKASFSHNVLGYSTRALECDLGEWGLWPAATGSLTKDRPLRSFESILGVQPGFLRVQKI